MIKTFEETAIEKKAKIIKELKRRGHKLPVIRKAIQIVDDKNI